MRDAINSRRLRPASICSFKFTYLTVVRFTLYKGRASSPTHCSFLRIDWKLTALLQVMDPCSVLALEQPLHPDSCVLVRFMEVESHGKTLVVAIALIVKFLHGFGFLSTRGLQASEYCSNSLGAAGRCFGPGATSGSSFSQQQCPRVSGGNGHCKALDAIVPQQARYIESSIEPPACLQT